ncbi:CD1375 family protein [Listeria monocytogenes]|uniref:CD1375 family protein n=1 Tax=Listeria monocytogenes TaxID=1639 RepID=UPI000874E5D7|nr:CD1375 family protein [Listeria monocytogenes]EIL9239370.1 hypothetical protein [Listeria monocytogenes]OFH40248.1 hypothetical protein BJM84_02530 [Listeria monocytogenes]
MAYMIPIYVNLVMNNRKSIEEVPANLRGQVKEKVDALYQEAKRKPLNELGSGSSDPM